MDGWRGHLEVAPHVGLGWGYFVDPGIGVNKGQILALFFGETGVMREVTRLGGLIHQSFFQQGGHDEYTIPPGVEPIGA